MQIYYALVRKYLPTHIEIEYGQQKSPVIVYVKLVLLLLPLLLPPPHATAITSMIIPMKQKSSHSASYCHAAEK
jgi:hypothetical protein